MNTMPPPRYRIMERGRRLITVDTATATEVGLAAQLGGDPVFMVSPVTSLTDLRPHSHAGEAAYTPAEPKRAPQVIRAQMAGPTKPPAMTGRWVVVLVGVMALIGFLIMTSLWIVVVLLLMNGTTRGWLAKGLKPLAIRIKEWAAGA